jgi:hypothetical protein
MSFIPFQEDDSVISTEAITAGLWTNLNFPPPRIFTSCGAGILLGWEREDGEWVRIGWET